MARRASPEQTVQREVFRHLRQRAAPGVFAWHTPNGGKRSPIEGAIFAGLGVVPGVPDVMLVKGGHLYALELKSINGRISKPQEGAQTRLLLAGATVGTAYGLDAALLWLEDKGLLRGSSQSARIIGNGEAV